MRQTSIGWLTLWAAILALRCQAHEDVSRALLASASTRRDLSYLQKRRNYHTAIIAGDYLFIEGGEASSYHNGQLGDDTLPSVPANTTLVIPLNQAWTNSSVSIMEIPHSPSMPLRNTPSLWADPDEKALYRWGGDGPYGAIIDKDDIQLWVLPLDNSAQDDGAVSWTSQAPANPEVFNTISAGVGGASTTCGDNGYYIGGFGTVSSDPSFYNIKFAQDAVSLPGVLSYNMADAKWANDSTVGMNAFGSVKASKAVCLRDDEGEGNADPLIIIMGGQATGRWSATDYSSEVNDINNITVYNTNTKEWHSQMATGDTPLATDFFCAVAVKGQDDHYEIFIYGGRQGDGHFSGAVSILTIPGFHWFSTEINTQPREGHSCLVPSSRTTTGSKSDSKQMIVVGGGSDFSKWDDSDPWDNGLGVLDMTKLEWLSEFDPDAEQYDSPQMVKDWYNAGNLEKVQWTDSDVKNLFVGDKTSSSSGNSSKSSGSDSSPKGSSTSSNSKSSSQIGVIVGAAVGGAGLLAILIVLIFTLRRRRSKPQKSDPHIHTPPMDNPRGPHMLSSDLPPDYYAQQHLYQGDTRHSYSEQQWHSTQPHELSPSEETGYYYMAGSSPQRGYSQHGESELESPRRDEELPTEDALHHSIYETSGNHKYIRDPQYSRSQNMIL